MNSEREPPLPALRSTSLRISAESVIDVFCFILPSYYLSELISAAPAPPPPHPPVPDPRQIPPVPLPASESRDAAAPAAPRASHRREPGNRGRRTPPPPGQR